MALYSVRGPRGVELPCAEGQSRQHKPTHSEVKYIATGVLDLVRRLDGEFAPVVDGSNASGEGIPMGVEVVELTQPTLTHRLPENVFDGYL